LQTTRGTQAYCSSPIAASRVRSTARCDLRNVGGKNRRMRIECRGSGNISFIVFIDVPRSLPIAYKESLRTRERG
jgi:hypothetical protein